MTVFLVATMNRSKLGIGNGSVRFGSVWFGLIGTLPLTCSVTKLLRMTHPHWEPHTQTVRTTLQVAIRNGSVWFDSRVSNSNRFKKMGTSTDEPL